MGIFFSDVIKMLEFLRSLLLIKGRDRCISSFFQSGRVGLVVFYTTLLSNTLGSFAKNFNTSSASPIVGETPTSAIEFGSFAKYFNISKASPIVG